MNANTWGKTVIKILIYLWFLFKIVCLQHYNQHLDHFSVTQPLTLLLHDDTMHWMIWLGTTHPCNPPHYGLWVKLHFFTICMYKHCFLPVLLVFVMKCCIMMPCSSLCLKTIIAARFLHLYACLTCSSVHASILHPLLAHHHLCYCHVDVYCVFFYLHIFFLNCKYHVFLFSNHLVFFSFYNK